MNHKALVLLFYTFYFAGAANEEKCVKNGVPGFCRIMQQCPSALEEFKKKIFPQICSFVGSDPVVCCIDVATTVRPPGITTTQRPKKPIPDDIPVYDYVNNDGTSADSCEPLSPTLTASRTGQKAWDKCLEYQQKYVYTCDKGVALVGTASRTFHCYHNADDLIVGGEDAKEFEFPHMVLLGYGEQLENVQWLCGGSLISNNYVLTAGHCTVSRDFGPITYALMGALKRSQTIDRTKLRRVKRLIPYPDYAPPGRYHDIALVELDAPVTLSQYLVPACLHVANDTVKDDRASATGWGLTEHRGATADHLQKVVLTKFSTDECKEKFPVHRHMKQGLDTNTQICYGDKLKSKDTCQGDSGGPLQIKSQKIRCMYMIVGVTSFGKACGNVGDPGIYTRVSQYVPWIESEVWP